jgi:hypothetical protein
VDLGPHAEGPQSLGHLDRAADGNVTHGQQLIARFNASGFGGRASRNIKGLDALSGVQPGDAIVGNFEEEALLKINDSEENRSHGYERQQNGAQPEA